MVPTLQDYQQAWLLSVPGIRSEVRNQKFKDFNPATVSQWCTAAEMTTIIRHQAAHPLEELIQVCQRQQLSILFPHHATYPSLLSQISDPPSVLYVKGTLPNWKTPCIAVVGTRKITSYGHAVTRELTRQLVEGGFTIISGMMVGVDTVAHETALTANGRTIGVLGYGFGVPYFPREQAKVAKQIMDSGGCLLSEYPPWQPPTRYTFPQRNRIVAGLSLGVLVTEAAAKSGSKITARLAAEQGREVFAVPGPIDSIYSEGTKELINLGATLVTSADDIVEQLPLFPSSS